MGKTIFYISAITLGLIGALVSERFNRRVFMFSWIISGSLSSLLFLFTHNLMSSLIICTFVGASFGYGFPSCLAFLAENTVVEERGRVIGYSLIITFILIVSGLLLSQVVSVEQSIFVSFFLRMSSLVTLILDPCKRESTTTQNLRKMIRIPSFLLYFLPWVVFSIANGTTAFIDFWLENNVLSDSVVRLGYMLQYLSTAIFAFFSGIFADRFGRRMAIITGLVALGASYELLSASTSPSSYLITQIASGISWSFIIVAHLSVLGDLAVGSREKFYVFLVVPLLASTFFDIIAEVLNLALAVNIVSLILGIPILLMIFPLLMAIETLPDDKIRSRKLREYLRKVRKILETESR
jgi:MFS family permease